MELIEIVVVVLCFVCLILAFIVFCQDKGLTGLIYRLNKLDIHSEINEHWKFKAMINDVEYLREAASALRKCLDIELVCEDPKPESLICKKKKK